MTDICATLIALVTLYSTGHWIGGTVLLIWAAALVWVEIDDPTAIKTYLARFR